MDNPLCLIAQKWTYGNGLSIPFVKNLLDQNYIICFCFCFFLVIYVFIVFLSFNNVFLLALSEHCSFCAPYSFFVQAIIAICGTTDEYLCSCFKHSWPYTGSSCGSLFLISSVSHRRNLLTMIYHIFSKLFPKLDSPFFQMFIFASYFFFTCFVQLTSSKLAFHWLRAMTSYLQI